MGAVVVLRLIEEGHRTQLEQLAAAVAHVGDLFFEAARGGSAGATRGPQVAVRVDADEQVGDVRGVVPNARDVSAGLGARRPDLDDVVVAGDAGVADVNVVVAAGNARARLPPYGDGDVKAAGGIGSPVAR